MRAVALDLLGQAVNATGRALVRLGKRMCEWSGYLDSRADSAGYWYTWVGRRRAERLSSGSAD